MFSRGSAEALEEAGSRGGRHERIDRSQIESHLPGFFAGSRFHLGTVLRRRRRNRVDVLEWNSTTRCLYPSDSILPPVCFDVRNVKVYGMSETVRSVPRRLSTVPFLSSPNNYRNLPRDRIDSSGMIDRFAWTSTEKFVFSLRSPPIDDMLPDLAKNLPSFDSITSRFAEFGR